MSPGRESAADRHPRRRLSPRERYVLEHLALGEEIPEIAQRLGVTVETVRTYAKAAMRKLDARTRPQAVAIALRTGEIPPVTPPVR
ncbi:MAG: response regulator transcription factor [Solirubrobacteraceae bacterium]|nr:response regulator transcription factor [Solirubrobacteraceae bacterium]